MPITKEELAQGFQDIRNQFNDDPEINIEDARRIIAEEEAQLISDFVIGRQTNVSITGTSATGGAVTGSGTGTIQE